MKKRRRGGRVCWKSSDGGGGRKGRGSGEGMVEVERKQEVVEEEVEY